MSAAPSVDCTEELAADDSAVAVFLAGIGNTNASSLDATDQDFIRVLEDVVALLISKGLILFTELPIDAQQKIMLRQKMRAQAGQLEDLIGDD